MPKGPFLPSEFVPTQFSTAGDKANFGNTLLQFLDAGCSRDIFTKKFYNRLSMTFGHIAYCDIEGFYSTWFTGVRHRLGFIRKILRWPCHVDPKFTFSDVEQAIQGVVEERSYLAQYELRVAEALRFEEMNQLRRLEAKYRVFQTVESIVPTESIDAAANNGEGAQPGISTQMSLF